MTYPFFFFNDTATTEIYTLSLHDALPISLCRTPRFLGSGPRSHFDSGAPMKSRVEELKNISDRKSTRLNSSHQIISYAVFCFKKKNTKYYNLTSHTLNTHITNANTT